MYFRIIVKKNGCFLFRTSKITDAGAAANIYASISAGFRDEEAEGQEHSVEILQVDGLPVGSIIPHAVLLTLATTE